MTERYEKAKRAAVDTRLFNRGDGAPFVVQADDCFDAGYARAVELLREAADAAYENKYDEVGSTAMELADLLAEEAEGDG